MELVCNDGLTLILLHREKEDFGSAYSVLGLR